MAQFVKSVACGARVMAGMAICFFSPINSKSYRKRGDFFWPHQFPVHVRVCSVLCCSSRRCLPQLRRPLRLRRGSEQEASRTGSWTPRIRCRAFAPSSQGPAPSLAQLAPMSSSPTCFSIAVMACFSFPTYPCRCLPQASIETPLSPSPSTASRHYCRSIFFGTRLIYTS
ncbi:hypothetical protein DAI22_07g123150 [Oryza sativa Japonica Group]|nr:hypothetical protein DAI22_07g123150 [Oryza sativa Japonica Group]